MLHRSISVSSWPIVSTDWDCRLLAKYSASNDFSGDEKFRVEQISWKRREKMFRFCSDRTESVELFIVELFFTGSQIQFFDFFLRMRQSQRTSVKSLDNVIHVESGWTRMNRPRLNRLFLEWNGNFSISFFFSYRNVSWNKSEEKSFRFDKSAKKSSARNFLLVNIV